MMLTVHVVLFDGFDLLDAIAPYEVFCVAAMKTDKKLNVQFVTAEGARLVSSGTNGVKLEAVGKLDPELADMIVVPGASGDVDGDGPDSVPMILSRASQTELAELIRVALDREDCIVATVCGGSLVLAMAGMLEGRPAVTHHQGMGLLEATGAIPISARVVEDGNLITGGAVTSGLDVALYMLERELGPQIAHSVEQLFDYERRGTVWRAQGLTPTHFTHSDTQRENQTSTDIPPEDDQQLFTLGNQHTHLHDDAARFDGQWDTTIATPVGKLQVKLAIAINNGVIQGTATQGDETVSFIDPMLHSNKLVWLLPITKPMRLNLKFEVAVHGDVMSGTAKAGVLPASKLTGKRMG